MVLVNKNGSLYIYCIGLFITSIKYGTILHEKHGKQAGKNTHFILLATGVAKKM